MASNVASAIRPGLRDRERTVQGSPHTPPTRHFSSVHSSPGSSFFRAEEDPVIIQLDPRFIYAGFQGDSGPQCCVRFTPEANRRVGDYRSYMPGFKRRRENVEETSSEYELWRANLKDVDLGLLEDKLERAVREAYNKHLFVDAGVARLILVLPSLIPHPVLDTVLRLFFERWKYSSITLLPTPAMTVLSAGLRSGVVVDIGWEETVVSVIYEYREVSVWRSTRAMKLLLSRIADLLETIRKDQDHSVRDQLRLDFDFVEDFVLRAGACHMLVPNDEDEFTQKTRSMKLEEPDDNLNKERDTSVFAIDWPTDNSFKHVSITRRTLQQTCVDALVGSQDDAHADDEEQPIDLLLYKALLSQSSDVRSVCVSRIIFSGEDSSSIHGLSRFILGAVGAIVRKHGWTAVRGKNLSSNRSGLTELAQDRATPPDARYHTDIATTGLLFEEQLMKQKLKPVATTDLRQAESLGPWAGASLVSSLKAKSFVEIERERYLAHGLASASREVDYTAISQRTAPAKAGEKSNWTLAGWG